MCCHEELLPIVMLTLEHISMFGAICRTRTFFLTCTFLKVILWFILDMEKFLPVYVANFSEKK